MIKEHYAKHSELGSYALILGITVFCLAGAVLLFLSQHG